MPPSAERFYRPLPAFWVTAAMDFSLKCVMVKGVKLMPAIFTVRCLDEPAVTESRKYSAKPAKQEDFKVGTCYGCWRLPAGISIYFRKDICRTIVTQDTVNWICQRLRYSFRLSSLGLARSDETAKPSMITLIFLFSFIPTSKSKSSRLSRRAACFCFIWSARTKTNFPFSKGFHGAPSSSYLGTSDRFFIRGRFAPKVLISLKLIVV